MKQLKYIIAIILMIQQNASGQHCYYHLEYFCMGVGDERDAHCLSFSDSATILLNRWEKQSHNDIYYRQMRGVYKYDSINNKRVSSIGVVANEFVENYSPVDTINRDYPNLEGVSLSCYTFQKKYQPEYIKNCHFCFERICKIQNLKLVEVFPPLSFKPIPKNVVRVPPCLKDLPELVALRLDCLEEEDYPIIKDIFEQRQLIFFSAFGKVIPFDSTFWETIVKTQTRIEYLQMPIWVKRIPDDIAKLDSLRLLDLWANSWGGRKRPIPDTVGIQLSWSLAKLKNLRVLNLGFIDLSKRENIDILTALPELNVLHLSITEDNYKNIDWDYLEQKLTDTKLKELIFFFYSRKNITHSKQFALEKKQENINKNLPHLKIHVTTNLYNGDKIPRRFSKYNKRIKKWHKLWHRS